MNELHGCHQHKRAYNQTSFRDANSSRSFEHRSAQNAMFRAALFALAIKFRIVDQRIWMCAETNHQSGLIALQ